MQIYHTFNLFRHSLVLLLKCFIVLYVQQSRAERKKGRKKLAKKRVRNEQAIEYIRRWPKKKGTYFAAGGDNNSNERDDNITTTLKFTWMCTPMLCLPIIWILPSRSLSVCEWVCNVRKCSVHVSLYQSRICWQVYVSLLKDIKY